MEEINHPIKTNMVYSNPIFEAHIESNKELKLMYLKAELHRIKEIRKLYNEKKS